jgi:hypothetical protein
METALPFLIGKRWALKLRAFSGVRVWEESGKSRFGLGGG